jgi:tricorn protease
MKIRTLLPLLGLGALAPAMLAAAPAAQGDPVPAGMLRYPDVSSTHIVFSYANDLWLVSREGGVAMPLASPDGQERFPRFSPDGQSIAFVGNYEGNNDLYTISVHGGVANRVTHHPGTETLSDWMANGDLLFYRNGHAGLARQASIFTVDQAGGMPEALPVPYGTVSSVSEDGKWLAYTPRTRDSRTWKRYRGGLATDIWLFNLEDNSAEKITDWEGTDTQPMWWNNALYYLSDQGEANRLNIWKYSPRAKKHEQVTFFKDNDIRWPAVGPGYANQGEIVFQLGSDLMLLNLKFNKLTTVEVVVPGDRPYLRPRTVDASEYIAGWDISPSGKRAVVEARGDIWTLPAENGVPRNLTATSGVGERSPSWSPDARWIAYFSDATGEYEICVKQSDGKGEVRQLTNGGGVFKLGQGWSPDSEHLMWLDCAGNLMLTTVETSETKQVDSSPFGFWIGSIQSASFSHDSSWITYSRSADDNAQTSIWLYNIESGERHQVTSGFFADGSPTFDRKGEYLYFTSARNFQPSYSAIDSSFIYEDSNVLLAVPLKADAERVWAPEHDEETWEDDDAKEDDDEEGSDEDDGDESTERSDDDGDDDSDSSEPVADDGISGTWTGTMTGDGAPPEGVEITVELAMSDGKLSGTIVTPMGNATVQGGSFDPASGAIKISAVSDDGMGIEFEGTVDGSNMTGTALVPSQGVKLAFSLSRSWSGSGGSDADESGDKKKDEPAGPVEIDLEGFEARAIQLPVSPGNFGNLAVNNKNQLIYARRGDNGGIKMFDLSDDSKSEKSVSPGFGFSMNADGSKMILPRGRSAAIQNASAGASGKTVPTDGMMVRIDPREEWKQVFTDAWRIFRDYFYDPNIHGVDWQGVHDHYAAMIDHCASREDLTFLIGEMIAEANVGHAYLQGNGDGAPAGPRVNVGMLGVDWEMHEGAYRIAKILRGAAWDSDAISPLGMPGIDVSEGDYVLAVNGLPLSTDEDPYAAFQGMANREVVLTVSAKPSMDEEAREVIVKTMGNESTLRMRAWIEKNRKYVDEMTGGRVGYIYVPDTGLNGQNNLFRQFYGQSLKDALIIDERWNGGGQIPTRFIELLNRPATNYWATRGQQDIHWPPDSHQGPKAMLINEDAGSGGDAFPHYFRQAGIGKLIGRRTWGGLVGISGNPSLIDGGRISVPTFAFYDNDGTWGIEGHGVDPDIEVMDHPALMVEGGDPQLDAGIKHILSELERNGYKKPSRPAYPDRSGLGIKEEDK